MGKWLAGIAAAIIASVVAWYLTREPPAPPEKSFIESVAGNYTLVSWRPAQKPVVMGVSVREGTLNIDLGGSADWDLGIWDSAARPQPPTLAPSRIKCGGQVDSSRQLRWTPGGGRNEAINWERGIDSVHDMVNLAFCGGTSPGQSAPFNLIVDQRSNGQMFLEMSNSEGAFNWQKR